MSNIDINEVQQNIKELQDQNAIDFQQWKKLGQDIEKLKESIKTTDKHYNLLMTKIKGDYESLKKIIIDENVQIQLNNKINENKAEIDTKVNIETFNNSVNMINEQMNLKASKDEVNVERKRIDLLTRIESGETDGNVELLDIRIGANNESYESAGQSVRGQVNWLNSKITNDKNIINSIIKNDEIIEDNIKDKGIKH